MWLKYTLKVMNGKLGIKNIEKNNREFLPSQLKYADEEL